MADAAHEAVISVTAADVSYGDDSDVQSALDDLVASTTAHDAQLTDLLMRLESLEDRVAQNETVLSESQIAREALAAEIAAVKLAQPDHTSEIADLAGAVAEQKVAVAVLGEQVSAPVECPSGTVRGFTTCIDAEARGETGWRFANDGCFLEGGHLCTVGEYLDGCLSLAADTETTMTSDTLSVNTILTVTMNLAVGCIMTFGDAPVKGAELPFRCCWDLGRDWAATPKDP
jgi:hypothetical protein